MAKQKSTIAPASQEASKELFDVLLDDLADSIADGFTKDKADALCADLAKYGIGAKPFPSSCPAKRETEPQFNKATGIYYDIEIDWDEFQELKRIVGGIGVLLNMCLSGDSSLEEVELVAEMLEDRGKNFSNTLAERFDQVKAAKEGGSR